ncbi:MAG: hypothetical protein JWO74_643 [Solirubrobacterales bacterium]|jgi:hypothetical protein|nr:hypothetical protein [Solirubrobacterales bacterium]
MTETPRSPTPETALAWEAEQRARAGYSALGAAVLTIIGSVVTGLGLKNLPKFDDRIVTIVDALRLTAEGRPIPPGRLAAQAEWLGHHATLPIIGALLFGLGTLLIFPPLAYLFRATRARRPMLPQVALVLGAIGVVGFGVGRTVAETSRYLGAKDFIHAADHTNSAAADALGGSTFLIGQIIWQAGALGLGFAFVLLCLNAMRVGLLTRFMGILGLIVGVTFVLPLDQQGIIRVFWLAALGVLILGRWPGGAPKAWETGKAEPWPTQQEVREQREAARVASGGEPRPRRERRPAAQPPPAPARPESSERVVHSGSKKRKRKRRS